MPKTRYCCTLCEYSSDRKSNFSRHISSHSNPKGRIEKAIGSNPLSLPGFKTKDGQLKCNSCSYSCNDASNIRRHIKTHLKLNHLQQSVRDIISKKNIFLVYGAGCSSLPQVGYEDDIYGLSYEEMHSGSSNLRADLSTYTKWIQAHARFKERALLANNSPFCDWIKQNPTNIGFIITQNVDGLEF